MTTISNPVDASEIPASGTSGDSPEHQALERYTREDIDAWAGNPVFRGLFGQLAEYVPLWTNIMDGSPQEGTPWLWSFRQLDTGYTDEAGTHPDVWHGCKAEDAYELVRLAAVYVLNCLETEDSYTRCLADLDARYPDLAREVRVLRVTFNAANRVARERDDARLNERFADVPDAALQAVCLRNRARVDRLMAHTATGRNLGL
jgi:hypothetical protein